jgi:hypothetical protein
MSSACIVFRWFAYDLRPQPELPLAYDNTPLADYIAGFLHTTRPLLYRRFRAELDRGRALRDGTLQMRQFAVALAGSPVMLKWLGTQWLGQQERIQQVSSEDPLTLLLAEMQKASKRIGPPENEDYPLLPEATDEGDAQ